MDFRNLLLTALLALWHSKASGWENSDKLNSVEKAALGAIDTAVTNATVQHLQALPVQTMAAQINAGGQNQ